MAKKAFNNEVYNTETGKTYKVHPSFMRDKKWLASRGLVSHEPLPPVTATNLPKAPDVTLTAPSEDEDNRPAAGQKAKGGKNAS